MDFGFSSVAAITVICYLVAAAIKVSPLDSKWIPVICGVLGALLGPVALLLLPSFPADDYLSATAVGIVSGFAATGVNQALKQVGGDD